MENIKAILFHLFTVKKKHNTQNVSNRFLQGSSQWDLTTLYKFLYAS